MLSVCGGNQVRSTKTNVSCLQSSMVVGVSWSGLNEWCRHWGATVHWLFIDCWHSWFYNHECQHVLGHTEAEHDPLPSETGPQGSICNMTTTTALLKKLRVNVMDWPSMFPDLNPIEHLWGILKQKVEERKFSNIHQLRDVVMEEWKRTPVATCEALVNSMPKRVKAVLENNGGHTKYWHFGPNVDIYT